MFRIKGRWRRGLAVIARVIFGAVFCFPFVLTAGFAVLEMTPTSWIGTVDGETVLWKTYAVVATAIVMGYALFIERRLIRACRGTVAYPIVFIVFAGIDGLLVAGFWLLTFFLFFTSGTRYLDASFCRHDPFIDEVTRCNGRSYSFIQSYLFASATKGQPTFDQSKLRQSKPKKLQHCREASAHWRVTCRRFGVPASYTCYFCAFESRNYDVDYSLLALHNTRPVAVHITTGNIDIRKPENHPAKLSDYFDLKIMFAD